MTGKVAMSGKRAAPQAGTAAAVTFQASLSSTPTAGKENGIVALHRSRMFDWQPSAIACISACPDAPLAAVGLENGDLELWDLDQLVCLQRVTGPGLETTALAWALDVFEGIWRTFVAYLDGSIWEVAWRQSAVISRSDSYGGVVWALAAPPAHSIRPGFSHSLAAACDDGSVRLFSVEGGEPGVALERSLAQLQGRLLALAWLPNGKSVAVAGTEGTIHILEATQGREQLRITAGTATGRQLTVWRLLALPDGSLVSGDSEGAVQVWDARSGTQRARFQRHAADVLALAASPDGSSVWASGVDSQVALFQHIPVDPSNPASISSSAVASGGWAYVDCKRPHTHDVRALAVVHLSGKRALLLSGGLDAQLVAYPLHDFLKHHPTRLCKAPQRPHVCSSVAGAEGGTTLPRLLIAQHDSLDVCQLGSVTAPGAGGPLLAQRYRLGNKVPQEGDPVELSTGPRHLARIQLHNTRIISAAASPDGHYVAACTPAGTRLYNIMSGHQPPHAASSCAAPSIRRIRLVAGPDDRGSSEADTAVAAAFAGHDILVLATAAGALACYRLPQDSSGEDATEEAEPAAAQAFAHAKLPAQRGAGTPSSTSSKLQPGALHPGGTASKTQQLAAQRQVQQALVNGAQQAWRRYAPAVNSLHAAPSGSILAVVSSCAITFFTLPQLQQHGRVLHTDSPLLTAAFSPDSQLLVAVSAAGQLHVWEVATCKPAAWGVEQGPLVAECLAKMPGTPMGLTFHPDPQTRRLLVSSPGALLHLDLTLPLEALGLPAPKRQRGRQAPTEAQKAAWGQPVDPKGRNGRMMTMTDPAVYVGHVSADAVLLLEQSWEDVLQRMPAPLYRKRYGQ